MKKILLFLLLSYVGYANAAEPATVVAPATNAVNNYLLYPTTNIYTFLLLDTIYGDVWHVQWSQEADNRGIIPIRSIF